MKRLCQQDFARFVGALFGVSLGSAFALALACLIFPAPAADYDAARQGTLAWAKSWGHQEEREMAFFFLTLIFGGTLGYVGASRYFGGRRVTLFRLVFLAAIVPAATMVISAAMTSSGLAATAYATLAIIVLVAAICLIKRVARDPTPQGPASIAGKRASPAPSDRRAVSTVLVGAICLAVTTIFAVPLGTRHIAAVIGFDMHMASFMVGPATYSFAGNLYPGIDYFTQYSVGTPWLFSFFLAPTASETMVNAVWFVIAEILFFQLSLLFFCIGSCEAGDGRSSSA